MKYRLRDLMFINSCKFDILPSMSSAAPIMIKSKDADSVMTTQDACRGLRLCCAQLKRHQLAFGGHPARTM